MNRVFVLKIMQRRNVGSKILFRSTSGYTVTAEMHNSSSYPTITDSGKATATRHELKTEKVFGIILVSALHIVTFLPCNRLLEWRGKQKHFRFSDNYNTTDF
jgi:hypothetical protein